MEKKFFALGSFFAGLAVATGSFGAHGLQKMVPVERLTAWEKAVRYQRYHAFALLFVAWAITQWWDQAKTLKAAGWSFIAGIVIFSGSLYVGVFTGDLQTCATIALKKYRWQNRKPQRSNYLIYSRTFGVLSSMICRRFSFILR